MFTVVFQAFWCSCANHFAMSLSGLFIIILYIESQQILNADDTLELNTRLFICLPISEIMKE